MLLMCGFNGFKQIPGHSDPYIDSFSEVKDLNHVQHVAFGWSYAIFILQSGKICKEGFKSEELKEVGECVRHVVAREKSAFGISVSGKVIPLMDCKTKISDIENVKVSTYCRGDEHEVAVTTDGELLSCRVELPGFQVKDVSCGYEHNLLLTTHGMVYSWGRGSRGQLGQGTLESSSSPVLLESLAGLPVTTTRAGGWHSAVLTSWGDLYTWGWNDVGQLGISNKEEKRGTVECWPTLVDAWEDSKVILIDCGSRHTVAVLDDSTVWSWGCNDYGQLGLGKPTDPQFVPQKVPLKSVNIKKIICGYWNSALVVEEMEPRSHKEDT